MVPHVTRPQRSPRHALGLLGSVTIEIVEDRSELVARFRSAPALHAYGLADLDDRYWAGSTWWRRDDAIVGRVALPGSSFVPIYAITADEDEATIDLLVDLVDEFPDGALVLAPTGADDAIERVRPIERLGPHRKMTLTTLVNPPSIEPATPLTHGHLPALLELHDRAPGEAFFIPSMLEGGTFYGIWSEDGTRLLAAGGTHVRSDAHRVAALGGILTDPDHRRRGLAATVTAAITADLLADGFTVSLNVRSDNLAAQRVYQRLGFGVIHDYVEFELLGHPDLHG